jgi:hypothetical protein
MFCKTLVSAVRTTDNSGCLSVRRSLADPFGLRVCFAPLSSFEACLGGSESTSGDGIALRFGDWAITGKIKVSIANQITGRHVRDIRAEKKMKGKGKEKGSELNGT